MSMNLQSPIDYLKGVGPNRADLLRQELGIHTYQDLLNLFPNRYLDRTQYQKITRRFTGYSLASMDRIRFVRRIFHAKAKRLGQARTTDDVFVG